MSPETFGVTADLETATAAKLLWSTGLLVVALLLRYVAPIPLRTGGPLSDSRLWWINFLKQAGSGLLILGLIVVWAEEIGDFALSIAAFALALVIVTKEITLCYIGAVWRGLAAPFTVGDWIEIGGFSGEVVEEDLMATRLQEIDPEDFRPTGRLVSVPNSLLLTEKTVNHSFRKRYIHLVFELHAEPHAEALETRRRIEAAMAARSVEFADVAQRYVGWIERRTGSRFRDPAPKVTIHTTDMAKLVFRVAVFCPRDLAAELREVAISAFLAPGSVSGPADAPAKAA